MVFNLSLNLLKNKLIFKEKAFSIVELIVVCAVIITISAIGIAGYSKFNQNQTLQQAASDLKSRIKDAQNRAFNGEKLCQNQSGANVCQVGSVCGDAGDLTLDSWRIEGLSANGNTYRLIASCNGHNFGQINYVLPAPLRFESISGIEDKDDPGHYDIVFKAFSNGVDIPRVITIVNTSNNLIAEMDVNGSGEINITYSVQPTPIPPTPVPPTPTPCALCGATPCCSPNVCASGRFCLAPTTNPQF